MSVKAKTASENQLILCAYYYYSLQTLTIGFNHCNMIVHTWAKRYRGGCFSYSVSVDCHITVKCDFASSDKKYKNHGLFCFFVRGIATWMRILASKCHRNMINRWYVKQQRRYCRPRIHKITKDCFFFFFSTLQSLLCKFKNLQKQVESRWLPKNRQKRQIA